MTRREAYDDRMDPECIALCDALNALPGITTFESCCGHGKMPFRVFFFAESLEALPAVAYWADACHSGCYGWKVLALTDCAMSPVWFLLEGPVGSFASAEKMAGLMREGA